MLDILPDQSRQDVISLAGLRACEKLDEGHQFAQDQISLKKQVGNAEGMEEIDETPEEGVSSLKEVSFQEQGVFGNPQEEEITTLHSLQNLVVEFFSVLLEKIVTAGIEPARLDGAHEPGQEILYRAWEGEVLFVLLNAHPDPKMMRVRRMN